MRKALCCILTLCLLFSGVLPARTYAQTYEKADDALNDANRFLEDKLGLVGYYILQNNGKELNKEYAQKGTPAFSNKPIFVYGDQVAASMEATSNGSQYVKNSIYRAMGYTVENSAFPNPDFPHDNEGYLAEHKKWVKFPWTEGIRKESYDGEDGSASSRDLTNGALNLIKRWTNEDTRFKPNNVEGYTGQRNFFAARAEDVPPALKDNFEDFLYIVQPPTEHSWGLGAAFYYWDGFNRFNYKSFLLKPFVMDKDLSAEFGSIPIGAVKEDLVSVQVKVNSTYQRDLTDVSFRWEIAKTDGTSLPVTFSGDSDKSNGTLDIPVDKKEIILYAAFKMPNNSINVKFQINTGGTNPNDEEILTNNTIERVIVPKVPEGQYDLDYNILSRKVKFPLSDADITAQLSLPRGHWDGNATGTLNVDNQAYDLFRDFDVTNNPLVNEASTTIVRNPEINTTFYRTDFGDDPAGHNWLNWTPSWEPKTRTGSIAYHGSVKRPYEYTIYHADGTTSTGHGTAHASFDSGQNTSIVRARIYNGSPVITPQIFQNQIDNNYTDKLRKNPYWTSEPYNFDVIRWMYHVDENGIIYAPTPVDGQYQRIFTQQCSAVNTAKAASSMAQDYERSREAARSRNYSKDEYDKAVFASDIDFRDIDYPIKSGYYFNPTGTYTFTVKTVTYKTVDEPTRDHRDLVDAVIGSFRYETDLMYINSHQDPVNLQNELLPDKGSSYKRKPVFLTVNDPWGVDEIELLKVETGYNKETETIYHSEDVDSDTHRYFKEILEGYGESGTLNSYEFNKYREYIKDGQYMYKLTETTTITIRINPENKKIYTHPHMPDGKYYVKAWLEDIDLTLHASEYKKLGIMRGIASLDQIEVSVKGSMYDDVK
ncbi:MAG: hypothetical protein PHV03_11680 [Desulfitobacteriaceae bacterium]|nr:hypothetical protein [Desulfitobacteriaceae bacterium]MDD4403049.1 hypothetical protein [Desulfitobacteriaceae bacterium]